MQDADSGGARSWVPAFAGMSGGGAQPPLPADSPEFDAPQAVELESGGTPRVPTPMPQPSRAGRVNGGDPGESRGSLDATEHGGGADAKGWRSRTGGYKLGREVSEAKSTMIKPSAVAALAALLAAAAPSASLAQAAGTWVLAPWKGSSVLYPGVVQSLSGGQVRVKFDDGTVGSSPTSAVRLYDWRPGTRVVCQWTDGREYPGRITRAAADGVTLDVLYEDGDRQRTTTGKCHTP